jgi:hypothetical protein
MVLIGSTSPRSRAVVTDEAAFYPGAVGGRPGSTIIRSPSPNTSEMLYPLALAPQAASTRLRRREERRPPAPSRQRSQTLH